MAATLSSLEGRQATATEQLTTQVNQFLDYCAIHPDATVRFMASDMVLALHFNNSHLPKALSKSRAAGHFYLTHKDDRNNNNRTKLTLTNIIKQVMGSAGESGIAALL